jgi:hypothetical protein
MDDLSVVADVLLTMELTVSSIPVGVPCYLDWRTEHNKGQTPVLKADRTGIINFGKVVTQATLVGSTGSMVEALMKIALFQAKEKGLLTGLLSQDKKTDNLLGDATFNCAEKIRLFSRQPLAFTRECDMKQFLLLDAPSLTSSSRRPAANFQLRVASECGVVRCRVGMDYFLVKGFDWVPSTERECYSLGIDFLTPSPLVRLSGMRRTPKSPEQQPGDEGGLGTNRRGGQQQLTSSQANNNATSNSNNARTRLPWKTESTNPLVSSSSNLNNNKQSTNNSQLSKASIAHENMRELDRLADELMMEGTYSPHASPEKSVQGVEDTHAMHFDAFLPSQERAANFRPRLARAMNEQEKEREREALEAAQAQEKSAVDKYLECVMNSAMKLKEQQQQQVRGGGKNEGSQGTGGSGGGGRLNLFKGGLGLGKFTSSRQQQQQQEKDKKSPETNPWARFACFPFLVLVVCFLLC